MTTGVLEKIPFTGIRMEDRPTLVSGLLGMCQALPKMGWRLALGVRTTRSTRMPSSRIQSWKLCSPAAPETVGRGDGELRFVVQDQAPYWLEIRVMESAVFVLPSIPAWIESS